MGLLCCRANCFSQKGAVRGYKRCMVRRRTHARHARPLELAIQNVTGRTMESQSPPTFKVLLGVMSNPSNPRLRTQLRQWNAKFPAYRSGVDVRYIFGSSFYGGANGSATVEVPAEVVSGARAEAAQHADLLYVDGRERLPHVGVVTEKSAAFWREVGDAMPGYNFYCKSDDDTLVHLDRLHAVLAHVARSEGPTRPVYLGHMKWRGWDTNFRFQACGGTWGNAVKTAQDILAGNPSCPHAAGPYPYMSGGMVCMSNALQRIVAADACFANFVTVAKVRNDHGTRCKVPALCAAQPEGVHMWHHEDAGIGFNVFRAIVYANASASLVPVPGHFNDPGIIERSPSAQDRYWSSRSLFVHGIKQESHFELANQRWDLSRPSEHLTLRCDRNCSQHGPEAYGWEWARVPCKPRVWSAESPPTGRFCHVEPHAHYRCCSWPWVVPQLRTSIIKAIAEAPGQRLAVHELVKRTRVVAAAAVTPTAECAAGCATIDVPAGQTMHAILEDLQLRGDLGYSASGRERQETRYEGREVWLQPRR